MPLLGPLYTPINRISLFLAHSSSKEVKGHPLEAHLTEAANLARMFASKFGADDLGRLAALWHDLGKLPPEFQEYIASPTPSHGPDHSSARAVLAVRKELTPLAYLIVGHHDGLPSYQNLKGRLPRKEATLKVIREGASSAGIPIEPSVPPSFPAYCARRHPRNPGVVLADVVQRAGGRGLPGHRTSLLSWEKPGKGCDTFIISAGLAPARGLLYWPWFLPQLSPLTQRNSHSMRPTGTSLAPR